MSLKSPAIRSFVEECIRADINANTRAPFYWPCVIVRSPHKWSVMWKALPCNGISINPSYLLIKPTSGVQINKDDTCKYRIPLYSDVFQVNLKSFQIWKDYTLWLLSILVCVSNLISSHLRQHPRTHSKYKQIKCKLLGNFACLSIPYLLVYHFAWT